jgi:hypothetical protein
MASLELSTAEGSNMLYLIFAFIFVIGGIFQIWKVHFSEKHEIGL